MKRVWIMVLVLLAGAALPISADIAKEGQEFKITSPSFKDKQMIPDVFTCHGANVNPELNIANIPPKTESLALIVDDPDAPEGTWVHWILSDIPPLTGKIAQNSKAGMEGLTDFGAFQYRGPCPNNKHLHHYSFRVYALSERIQLDEGYIKSDLERKMKGKILAQAELIGTYKVADNFNE